MPAVFPYKIVNSSCAANRRIMPTLHARFEVPSQLLPSHEPAVEVKNLKIQTVKARTIKNY